MWGWIRWRRCSISGDEAAGQWCRTRPRLLAERRCERRDGGGWGWATEPELKGRAWACQIR